MHLDMALHNAGLEEPRYHAERLRVSREYQRLFPEMDVHTRVHICRAEGEAAQLLGRMGTIEEVGKLCLFIAAEATFTTGVDHIISGGAELGYGRKSRRD